MEKNKATLQIDLFVN